MSNIKKIIGVVLAIVMALSVATIAFAAEGDDAYSVIITSDKATISETESATVTVSVTSNYYSNAMSIPVFFDSSKVTISDATALIDFGEVVLPEDVDDTYYAKSGYTKADHGAIVFLYVPRTHGPISKYETATAVMTFKVTAKAGVSGSVALECLEATAKTTTDASGALFVAKDRENGNTSEGLPLAVDNFTLTNATLSIAGGAEPADLAVKDASSGIIIDTNKTFGGQYAGVVYGFTTNGTASLAATYYNNLLEATNGGSLAYTKSPFLARGTTYGTGATITVKNADGSVSKTYVIVIFGDVTGDGKILAADTSAISKHIDGVAGSVFTSEILVMASNVVPTLRGTDSVKAKALHDVLANDYAAVQKYVDGTAVDINKLAKAHVALNEYYQ